MTTQLWAIAAALGSALCYAAAFVSQHHVAERVDSAQAKGLRLYLHLARKPLWWAGVLGDVGGALLQIVALGMASVVLVQPFLVTAMIFALPFAAIWNKKRIRRSDMVWAVIVVAALAVFTVIGAPTEPDHAQGEWLWPVGMTAAIIIVLLIVATRITGALKATMFGVVAGIFYSLFSVLTDYVAHETAHTRWYTMFAHWQIYALVVAVVAGTALQQSAFHAGPLIASLPATQVVEPLVGVALGVVVLQARFATHGAGWVLLAGSLIVMIVGTVALSRAATVES